MNEDKNLLSCVLEGIQNKKGNRIVVANLSDIETAPGSYFVICEATSPLHAEAIVKSVGDEARQKASEKPSSVSDLRQTDWMVMDYGTVIVHVFLPEARAYYDLEHLWADARLTQIQDIL